MADAGVSLSPVVSVQLLSAPRMRANIPSVLPGAAPPAIALGGVRTRSMGKQAEKLSSNTNSVPDVAPVWGARETATSTLASIAAGVYAGGSPYRGSRRSALLPPPDAPAGTGGI